jgi:F420-dependent oxidoreductase-like protein
MKMGLNLGYWAAGSNPHEHLNLALEAERLGYDSVWTAEAYGSDAVTPLTWIAAQTSRIKVGTAIMQMTARAPVVTAMTAATLDTLSGGRMLLGIGASGPQVVEGWHGVPYGKPLTRAREYVSIVRKALAREEPLEHHGEHYDIPTKGGSGLGKPLKLILHPLRPSIPIYLAAIGPKNVALAAEIADGWLPIFFAPRHMPVYRESLDEGFSKAGRTSGDLEISPTATVVLGDDVDACRNKIKPQLALYIGGMGAREKNFYFNLACRYGYEEAAMKIQDLFLGRKRDEAAAAVPDALVDDVALCGPKERIAERLTDWKASGITTLLCTTNRVETLRVIAGLAA